REGRDIGHGYRLIEKIGTGGFGEVWKAEGPNSSQVAAKIIMQVSTKWSQHELESLAKLKELRHPYLQSMLEAWSDVDYVVIIAELFETTLFDRARQCVRDGLPGIPDMELIRYFTEVADALDYLNKANVMLEDIKPDDIHVVSGHARLSIYGLVEAIRPATDVQALACTIMLSTSQ